MEKIVEKLRKLGLSEYEARVYVPLVGSGEASAREIHEVSKVPRTRVYDILKKLIEKGFVEIQHGNPTFFKPIHPGKVIGNLLLNISSIARDCIYELKNMEPVKRKEIPLIWVVRGEWTIKTKIRELVGEAENLSIVCPRTKFLHKIADSISGLNKKIRIIVMEEDIKLVEKLENVEIKIIDTSKFDEEHFFKNLFDYLRGVEEEGTEYQTECLLIADKKSIIVVNENGRRVAVIIRLPAIVYFQKNIVDMLWTR